MNVTRSTLESLLSEGATIKRMCAETGLTKGQLQGHLLYRVQVMTRRRNAFVITITVAAVAATATSAIAFGPTAALIAIASMGAAAAWSRSS